MHDFLQRFVLLETSQPSNLPFTVGGATQHGTHSGEEQNNQDAVSLHAGKDSIVGILCDGCSSASDLGHNQVSYCESGAQILSVVMLRHILERLRAKAVPNAELAKTASELCRRSINDMLYIFSPDAEVQEHLLREMFMATILAFVVTPERWCVMHCGDGLFAVNGQFTDLNKTSSGEYLANGLSWTCQGDYPLLQICAEGDTSGLDSILLASDGVLDIVEKGEGNLQDMIKATASRKYVPGYDSHFIREFRKRVAYKLEQTIGGATCYDDRTLLMVRRLSGQTELQNQDISSGDVA